MSMDRKRTEIDEWELACVSWIRDSCLRKESLLFDWHAFGKLGNVLNIGSLQKVSSFKS